MAALAKWYEKLLISNKIFLMKKLFNLKIADNESVTEYLNEFNTPMSQLESVRINFDEEIRALVLFSSLSETRDGLVMDEQFLWDKKLEV